MSSSDETVLIQLLADAMRRGVGNLAEYVGKGKRATWNTVHNSDKWKSVSEKLRKQINLVNHAQGEGRAMEVLKTLQENVELKRIKLDDISSGIKHREKTEVTSGEEMKFTRQELSSMKEIVLPLVVAAMSSSSSSSRGVDIDRVSQSSMIGVAPSEGKAESKEEKKEEKRISKELKPLCPLKEEEKEENLPLPSLEGGFRSIVRQEVKAVVDQLENRLMTILLAQANREVLVEVGEKVPAKPSTNVGVGEKSKLKYVDESTKLENLETLEPLIKDKKDKKLKETTSKQLLENLLVAQGKMTSVARPETLTKPAVVVVDKKDVPKEEVVSGVTGLKILVEEELKWLLDRYVFKERVMSDLKALADERKDKWFIVLSWFLCDAENALGPDCSLAVDIRAYLKALKEHAPFPSRTVKYVEESEKGEKSEKGENPSVPPRAPRKRKYEESGEKSKEEEEEEEEEGEESSGELSVKRRELTRLASSASSDSLDSPDSAASTKRKGESVQHARGKACLVDHLHEWVFNLVCPCCSKLMKVYEFGDPNLSTEQEYRFCTPDGSVFIFDVVVKDNNDDQDEKDNEKIAFILEVKYTHASTTKKKDYLDSEFKGKWLEIDARKLVDCDERKEFELKLISKESCAKCMVAKERKVEQEKEVISAEMLQMERAKVAQQLYKERMKNIEEEKQARIEFAKKYYQYSMKPAVSDRRQREGSSVDGGCQGRKRNEYSCSGK